MSTQVAWTGASGSGKTSVLKRHFNGTFNAHEMTTIIFDAWYRGPMTHHDCSGQMCYKKDLRTILRQCDWRVLVVDMGEALCACSLMSQIKAARAESSQAKLLVVGTKADVARVASVRMCQEKLGDRFVLCSAKYGVNTHKPFDVMLQHTQSPKLPLKPSCVIL